jgi:putative transposase
MHRLRDGGPSPASGRCPQRTELVIEALDMAAKRYPFADDVIFHSDRGVQYTSQDFADRTNQLGIRRSVGRTGVCYDNAQAETFTREHARKDVTRYIEVRYNTLRLHSALGYRTPREAYGDHTDRRPAA